MDHTTPASFSLSFCRHTNELFRKRGLTRADYLQHNISLREFIHPKLPLLDLFADRRNVEGKSSFDGD